ncbi:unnamed protein product [Ambrosiozyma monospora]|uniref:Unnamed protein product n=1 Tax=Ambrosiozyma monospora TaxID=43982 RepID=A0ACB5TJ25_AMBMO|nr:unnamed protein product [Ambrosiozyma monospora]
MRNPNSHQELLFGKADIPPNVCQELLMSLFTLMFKKGETPEKLAENEFLMKCIMRILLTAQDSLNEFAVQLLQQLLRIVDIIGKNPSNPKFSHYTFESICVLIKYNVNNIEAILETIKPTLLAILGQEIQEFTPYSFQILAYCLEVYPTDKPMPDFYEALVKPLCDPSIWQFRGNIPALKRLLQAIIQFNPALFNTAQKVTPILGVFQKLISSKTNDHLGFEYLESVLMNIDIGILQSFLNDIGVVILTRLTRAKTDKFVKRFIVFLCTISTLSISTTVNNKNQLNSTFAVKLIDNVQPGVFNQLFGSIIVPYITKFNNILDKKLLVVGLCNLVTENGSVVDAERSTMAISQLLKLVSSDSIKDYKNINENYELLLELDNDDLSFGSSFNRLNIIQNRRFDPIKNEIGSQEALLSYFKMKLSSYDLFKQQLVFNLDDEAKAVVQQLGLA